MSKSQLLRTIDDQKSQIELYETKLKDVIRAYKGVVKEKNALEVSLQALNSQPDENTTSPVPEIDAGDKTDTESITSGTSETASSKLQILQKALSTLTKEKTRVEAANASDRKRMVEENSCLKEQLDNVLSQSEKTKTLLQQQLAEVRANLRQSQCEQGSQDSNHAALIKELQMKITQQRTINQANSSDIDKLKIKLKEAEEAPFEYRETIGQLNAQLNQAREQITKQDKLKPNINQLHKEINDLKSHHSVDLREEQLRASQFEQQMSESTKKWEHRVHAMELRISDLSKTLGDYERTKQTDIANIDKLKARVTQLDSENTALSKAASFSVIENLDWQELVDRIKSLADKFNSTQAPVDRRRISLYDLLNLESPEAEGVHEKCRRDFEALNDEFEKYKLRAQARLKSVVQQKETTGEENGEVEHLRGIVTSLQSQLNEGKSEHSRNELQYQETVTGLRHTIAQLQTTHEKAIADAKTSTQARVYECEREMSRQRERTLELLAEKERELESVRGSRNNTQHPIDPRAQQANSPQISPHSVESVGSVKKRSSGSRDSESSAFGQSTTDRQMVIPEGETPNVYLRGEVAKKDKELSSARQHVRSMESAMRDLQHSSVTKDLRHFETIEKLKEEIRAVEAKLRLYKDDANIEYLKNVMVKYMLTDNVQGKEHMLKAIANVLKLTPKEVDSILKHNAKWSWTLP